MKTQFKNTLILFLTFLLYQCDDEDFTSRDFPRIDTLPVSENTTDGVRFSASFRYRGDFQILRYGFVWGRAENPILESNQYVVFTENIPTQDFSVLVESDLQRGVAYYVRAFVESEDFMVYGINQRFVSQGICNAFIDSFDPEIGSRLDTITVYGSGFSIFPTENIVRFGDNVSTVVSSTGSEMRVIVPVTLGRRQSRLSIEVDGTVCLSDSRFTWDYE